MAKPDVSVSLNHFARIMSFNGISIREDTLYSDSKGRENKGIRKRAEKALQKLEDPLRRVLQPGETILYVAQGLAPMSAFEQLTFGWYVYRIARTALVFTNRRMLHLLLSTNGSWKRSLRAVHWGDVEKVKVSGLLTPTFTLHYRNGKKETYWGIRRADIACLRQFAPAVIAGSVGESTAAQGMTQLCPDCLAALSPGQYTCANCGLVFRDEATMVRRSLLIPGGGYFYVGQTMLGIGDFFAEAYLLVLLLLVVVGAFAPPQPGQQKDTTGDVVIAIVLFLILVLEKWGTIHHCRRMVRDYIPTNKNARLGAVAVAGQKG